MLAQALYSRLQLVVLALLEQQPALSRCSVYSHSPLKLCADSGSQGLMFQTRLSDVCQ